MSTEATDAARRWYERTYNVEVDMVAGPEDANVSEVLKIAAYASTLTDDKAKLRALVQVLVDGLHAIATLADVDTDERGTIARDPLTAAKEQGFTPTNTEDT